MGIDGIGGDTVKKANPEEYDHKKSYARLKAWRAKLKGEAAEKKRKIRETSGARMGLIAINPERRGKKPIA